VQEERSVRLADGRSGVVRAIRPSDRDAFLAFHAALSEESRYLRYFSARRMLPELEGRLELARESAREDSQNVRDAPSLLARELRDAYEHLRKRL